jgi:hypothetical protein
MSSNIDETLRLFQYSDTKSLCKYRLFKYGVFKCAKIDLVVAFDEVCFSKWL